MLGAKLAPTTSVTHGPHQQPHQQPTYSSQHHRDVNVQQSKGKEHSQYPAEVSHETLGNTRLQIEGSKDAWDCEQKGSIIVPVILRCVLNNKDLSSFCQQGIGAEADLAGVGPTMRRQRTTGGDRGPPQSVPVNDIDA